MYDVPMMRRNRRRYCAFVHEIVLVYGHGLYLPPSDTHSPYIPSVCPPIYLTVCDTVASVTHRLTLLNLWVHHSIYLDSLYFWTDVVLEISLCHKCLATVFHSPLIKHACLFKHSTDSYPVRLLIWLSLYRALVTPHVEHLVQFWRRQLQKDIIEWVQRKASNMVEGLEHKTYQERLHLYNPKERRDTIDTFLNMLKG